MSNLARILYKNIKTEYQNRLDEGKSKQCIAFSKSIFITKYNYPELLLRDLLNELNDYGYIKKWITGDFELIID